MKTSIIMLLALFIPMLALVSCTPKEKRIIGGEEFEAGKYPWLISLVGKFPKSKILGITTSYNSMQCGGSLLNERWVLTAAHCFKGDFGAAQLEPSNWNAHLGSLDHQPNLGSRINNFFGRLFNVDHLKNWNPKVEKVIIHPGYIGKQTTFSYDIALLRLSEDMPHDANNQPGIQSVALPNKFDSSFPLDGQNCVMTGWGCTQNGGVSNGRALMVALPKLSDADCLGYYNIRDSLLLKMCAGYRQQNRGICPGDSGGPLVCRNPNREWVQVGIASYSRLRFGDYPGIFTRVSTFVQWIEETMRDN